MRRQFCRAFKIGAARLAAVDRVGEIHDLKLITAIGTGFKASFRTNARIAIAGCNRRRQSCQEKSVLKTILSLER